MELYAEAFAAAGALERLEGFASLFGPEFYGLAPNRDRVVLERTAWRVPEAYPLGTERVRPIAAGEILGWRLAAA